MSSSMFIEPKGANAVEDGKSNSDSNLANLVVVYGKNGINIDQKDLETLIEEKAVKTISVIRISSPTPSMEEAEEAAKAEAAKEALENTEHSDTEVPDGENIVGGRKDSSNPNSEFEESSSATEQNDEKQNGSSENDDKCEKSFRQSRSRNVRRKSFRKQQKSFSKKKDKKKDREVMGLTLEGFYEADAALQIAKEACKMAGIPYIRNTAEYEFMLFVIRNDHCYTPYTSPEQMKAKLIADKLEGEKIPFNTRKIQPQFNIPSKQLMAKMKKLPLEILSSAGGNKLAAKNPLDKDKTDEANLKQQKSINTTDENMDNVSDEDEESYELIDIEDSDFTGSEESADSDNDRDSDLDFNVNNRQSKKRRLTFAQKKARRSINAKIQERRLLSTTSSQDEGSKPQPTSASTTTTTTTTIAVSNVVTASSSGTLINSQRAPTIKTRVIPKNYIITSRQIRPPQITTTTLSKVRPILAAGSTEATMDAKVIYQKSSSTNPVPLRAEQIVQICDNKASAPRQNVAVTQPAVKEIVINKALSSPKGCFTELTTLISEAEKATTNQTSSTSAQLQPSTPTSTNMTRNIIATGNTGTPSRTYLHRFTCIDGATKNTLPAQISVETHQSSSELAAEHDKQLDLIDSIVNDELNKSLDNLAEQSSISTDENIPKIVQMLENTEKTLVKSSTQTIVPAIPPTIDTSSNVNTNNNNTTNTTSVDDIDISHDLPEDLLQHVVELIKDDKTLQEAVEKEIMAQENSFGNEQQHSNQTSTTPLPMVPTTTPSRSIIQMSISNTMSNSSVIALPNDGTSSFTGGSSPMSRRDPIQIVRGNGRVITLPPIEAPTTRAKRRAQVLPSGAGVGSSVESSPQAHVFNESSLEGSMHSNTSFVAMTPTTLLSTATENVEKKPAKRRSSKEVGTRSARKSTSNKSKRNSVSATKQDDAEDATESQADDDDPKKLWCICRQPHNNRFMICCDACGDWFHGTCVNVTKSMGREMEQKGLEWSCPQCIKKRDEKTQRKLTDMLDVRRTSSQSIEEKIKGTIEPKKAITSEKQVTAIKSEVLEVKKPSTSIQQTIIQTPTSKKAANVQNQKRIIVSTPSKMVSSNTTNVVTAGTPHVHSSSSSSKIGKTLLITPVRVVTSTPATPVVKPSSTPSTPTVVVAAPKIPCAFCKKSARHNSVYCSDDCIRRCAQNAINVYTAKSEEQEMVYNISSSSSSSNITDDKKKKAKGLFEDVLSMADRKPKVERMVVYERKSGTKLSGSNAPTTFTIRKWLHDNPTFEIVLPGSQLSIDIEKQQAQRSADANKQIAPPPPPRTPILKVAISSASTPHKSLQSPNNQKQISSTTKESSSVASVHNQLAIKSNKQVESSANTTPSPRPNTPKPQSHSRSAQQQQQQQQQHAHNRSDNKSPRNEPKDEIKSKERQLKRQSSDVSSTGSSTSNKKQDNVAAATSSLDNEPIRRNVRRTLKEQIMQRTNETSAQSSDAQNQLKLTPEDVDAFVKETEEELFNMFNRDTGARYKAKYRSLIFNIKDRKNRTLFAKICAKQIEPKQLVHMSPEELASQELAQWRQKENKHQLEMIKKSELDLLSCTKNFLFKNHKGEEVIESKESGAVCVNLDMTIPVEDVVNVLNNSNDIVDDGEISGFSESKAKQLLSSSTGGSTDEQTQIKYIQDQDTEKATVDGGKSLAKHSCDSEKERSRDKRHRSRSRESEKDRDRDRGRERRRRSRSKDVEKEKERERRHRSRERHYQRDKSRSRRKSHSRSKSRSRSGEKRSKSSHKERDRDRERERDKNKEKKASSSNASKSTTISQIHSKEKQRNSPIAIGAAKLKQTMQQQKSMECFNLIDQIIESSKTVEEAANLVHEKTKDKEKYKEQQQQQQSPVIASSSTTVESSATSTTTTTTPPQPTQLASSTADSDQEPSSTVSIPTPPHDPYAGDREEEEGEEPSFSRSGSPNLESLQQLWIGGLTMNEVASLQMKIYHLIGNTRNLGRLLAENLDVVGRIDGETVWEYLWKIRKSPNKEIVLIRFMPYNEDDTNAYANLFKYLDKKKRLGVIKSVTPQIKDFYIYPLGAGKQLPKVLQVTSHNDFYNDPYRTDMIIGILVRVLGKRITAPAPSAVAISAAAAAAKLSRHNHIEADSFTPPGSPQRSRKRSHKDDIDIDAIIKAPIGAKSMEKSSKIGTDADEPYSPGGSSDDDALPQYSGKRSSSLLLCLPNADEDLKRKMEEINRQIAAQEMEIAGLLNVEPNSSATVLANISIPANLPQILASIKSKDMKSLGDHVQQMNTTTFDEYNPEESALSSYNSSARHTPSTSIKTSTSRLAQLSEAELLSMVPDDMLDPEPPSKKKAKFSNVSPYNQEPPPPGV